MSCATGLLPAFGRNIREWVVDDKAQQPDWGGGNGNGEGWLVERRGGRPPSWWPEDSTDIMSYTTCNKCFGAQSAAFTFERNRSEAVCRGVDYDDSYEVKNTPDIEPDLILTSCG